MRQLTSGPVSSVAHPLVHWGRSAERQTSGVRVTGDTVLTLKKGERAASSTGFMQVQQSSPHLRRYSIPTPER